jgi:hypothetical protein
VAVPNLPGQNESIELVGASVEVRGELLDLKK